MEVQTPKFLSLDAVAVPEQTVREILSRSMELDWNMLRQVIEADSAGDITFTLPVVFSVPAALAKQLAPDIAQRMAKTVTAASSRREA